MVSIVQKNLFLLVESFFLLFYRKEKWWTPLFTAEIEPGVEPDFEKGLKCLECLPACDENKFSISMTRLPLKQFSYRVTVEYGRV